MNSGNDEQVVLVDEQDNEMGLAPKAGIHTRRTPLHRAFSVFLFNRNGEVLVQRRAFSKKTWPGIWSNSCCGHPLPRETYEAAIERRVLEELGVFVYGIEKVSDYRYRFEHDGIVENELCPVYRGVVDDSIKADAQEVGEWRWMSWGDFLDELITDQEGKWSEWCKEEVKLFTA